MFAPMCFAGGLSGWGVGFGGALSSQRALADAQQQTVSKYLSLQVILECECKGSGRSRRLSCVRVLL